MNDIKIIFLIILLMYSVIISVLYWTNLTDQEKQKRELTESLARRENELKRRESSVIDKELCFRELTKLKTVRDSALEILQSYIIQQSNEEQNADKI